MRKIDPVVRARPAGATAVTLDRDSRPVAAILGGYLDQHAALWKLKEGGRLLAKRCSFDGPSSAASSHPVRHSNACKRKREDDAGDDESPHEMVLCWTAVICCRQHSPYRYQRDAGGARLLVVQE
jgi:hypothetical protein